MDLEHERRLTEVESRSKSNTKRIDDVEQRQTTLEVLASSVKVLADREERLEKDVGEIKTDVKEIKGKPGKRWEGLIEKVIFTAVGALVTYLLFKLGIGS